MIFRLGLRADIINVVFLSLLLLASSRTFSFPLFLFSCSLFSAPTRSTGPCFQKEKPYVRTQSSAPIRQTPPRAEAVTEHKGSFGHLFCCFCTLGTHLFLQSQGSKATTRACFPFFSFHVLYLPPLSSIFSCSLLSFSFFLLARVITSVFLFSGIPLLPRRLGSTGWCSCLS